MESLFQHVLWFTGANLIEFVAGTLLTPAFIYAGMWALGKEKDVKNHRIRFFVVFGIISFAVTGCVLGLVSEVRPDRNSPDFKCEIIGVTSATFTAPDFPGRSTMASMTIAIRNHGAPSIAWNWKLYIRLLSGQVVSSDRVFEPMSGMIRSTQGRPPLPIIGNTNEFLPLALLESPMPTGGGKKGGMCFIFDASVYDEIRRPGTVWTLQFEGSDGRINVTSHTNETDRMLY